MRTISPRARFAMVALMLVVLGAVVVSTVASAGPQADIKPDACHVGSAPQLDIPRAPPGTGVHVVAGPAVLACGASSGSPYELVGLQRSDSFCYSVDQPRQRLSEGGFCKPDDLPWESFCAHFCLDPIHGSELHGERFRRTVLTGQMPLSFDSISISYRYRGRWVDQRAVIARIEGRLARKLRQTDPFGLYAAVLPVCVGRKSIRVYGEEAGVRDRPSSIEMPPRSTNDVCDVGSR